MASHMSPEDGATPVAKPKQKYNVCLIIAAVISVAYLIYSASYWGGAVQTGSSSSAQAGAAIASVLVMPHLVCTGIALVFNALAIFMHKAGFALVAGILYAVAMVLFFMYFFFVIAQMVLSFVGYSQLKKASATA